MCVCDDGLLAEGALMCELADQINMCARVGSSFNETINALGE